MPSLAYRTRPKAFPAQSMGTPVFQALMARHSASGTIADQVDVSNPRGCGPSLSCGARFEIKAFGPGHDRGPPSLLWGLAWSCIPCKRISPQAGRPAGRPCGRIGQVRIEATRRGGAK